MSAARLSVVAVSKGEQVKALQRQAKAEARALCEGFADQVEALAAAARDIGELGDAAPIGVRELASRIESDAAAKAATIRVILSRN